MTGYLHVHVHAPRCEESPLAPSIVIVGIFRCLIGTSTSEMSLVVRKPVFGVSEQVIHTPCCAVTEDS